MKIKRELDLLETLRDALEHTIKATKERRSLYLCEKRIEFLDQVILEYQSALSLLSTPDALAWALLEEMAEERVEVSELGKSPTDWIRRFQLANEPRGTSSVIKFQVGNVDARLRINDNGGQTLDYQVLPPTSPAALRDLILCLARALQEQRKREQERAVVDDFRGGISAALERGDLVKNPNGSLSISGEVSGE